VGLGLVYAVEGSGNGTIEVYHDGRLVRLRFASSA
jgi:hypothetical protein